MAWMLDLQVSGAPCFIEITTGAAQTAIVRRLRCDIGRIVLPLAGDFVTVDAVPIGTPPVAPFASVQSLLGIAPGSNAPLAPTGATSASVSCPALTTVTVAQQVGAGRILYNVGANLAELRIAGAKVATIAAATAYNLAYAGEFQLFSPVGTTFNVVNLTP